MTAVLIALCMYTLSLNDSRAHSRAHPSSHNTARTVLRLSVGLDSRPRPASHASGTCSSIATSAGHHPKGTGCPTRQSTYSRPTSAHTTTRARWAQSGTANSLWSETIMSLNLCGPCSPCVLQCPSRFSVLSDLPVLHAAIRKCSCGSAAGQCRGWSAGKAGRAAMRTLLPM